MVRQGMRKQAGIGSGHPGPTPQPPSSLSLSCLTDQSPPPPPPHTHPKSSTQVGGGGGEGSKSKNLMGDHFFRKKMILQGIRHPISCLGVCYVNDPQKGGGGCMASAPTLDLTTSLQGDFSQGTCADGVARVALGVGVYQMVPPPLSLAFSFFL